MTRGARWLTAVRDMTYLGGYNTSARTVTVHGRMVDSGKAHVGREVDLVVTYEQIDEVVALLLSAKDAVDQREAALKSYLD